MATKTTRIDIEITLLSHPDSLRQIGRQTIVTITVPVPFISLKLTFIARAYMHVDLYYVHLYDNLFTRTTVYERKV